MSKALVIYLMAGADTPALTEAAPATGFSLSSGLEQAA